jgi:predicted NUDIX family NTP pyrophosphohydrolase
VPAGACKNEAVTFEAATERLIALARTNGGVVTAAAVEADPELAAAHETVSAAAHALAGSTNVFASSGDSSWFPYEEIRFTDLR